jgi:NAD-dependent deacetylase
VNAHHLTAERHRFVRSDLRKAELFVAIGTSGAVYPAAGFVAEARAYGLRTCEINLEAADNADLFDEQRLGPASETVPAWVGALNGGGIEV